MRHGFNATVVASCIGLLIALLLVRFIDTAPPRPELLESELNPGIDADHSISLQTAARVNGRSAEAADAAGPAAPELPIWSRPPAEMEAILLERLAELDARNILSISSYHCDESRCEVVFITNHRFEPPGFGLGQTAGRAPFEGNVGFSARCHRGGICERRMVQETYREPTREEIDMKLSGYVENLRSVAARLVPPDDPYAPPAQLNQLYTVENFCSVDCPLDLRQVIHSSVPEDKNCAEIDGAEEAILARAADGSFHERRLCVPNVLIRY